MYDEVRAPSQRITRPPRHQPVRIRVDVDEDHLGGALGRQSQFDLAGDLGRVASLSESPPSDTRPSITYR